MNKVTLEEEPVRRLAQVYAALTLAQKSTEHCTHQRCADPALLVLININKLAINLLEGVLQDILPKVSEVDSASETSSDFLM